MTKRQFAEAFMPQSFDDRRADAYARFEEAKQALRRARNRPEVYRARRRVAEARALCEEFGVSMGSGRSL